MMTQEIETRIQQFLKIRCSAKDTINAMLEMEFVDYDIEHKSVTLAFPIKTRWDEKAQEKRIKKKRPFAITELSMEEHEGCLMLTGYLENRMKKSAKYVVAKLTFFDSEKNIVKEDKWYLVGREPLKQNEKVPFTYTITEPEDVKDFEIHIIKYKH